MIDDWADRANMDLYNYYMDHPDEFREKYMLLQTILVDYAKEKQLPFHPDWFDHPEVEKTNTNVNDKDSKKSVSEKAYHDAVFGAWDEYTNKQKEYVLNYAKDNNYFIPSYWLK